jgi:hypothetical protein
VAESAQARQQQIITQLQGEKATQDAALATAQTTITEQAGRITFLENNQPKIPEDLAPWWDHFYQILDNNLALRMFIPALEEAVAVRDRTIADIPLVEQGLRDRLLAAEQNAVPNLEQAAENATLKMQVRELESKLQPVPDEVTARLEAEAQMRASFWEWSTRVQPASIRAWEAEHRVTPTTGGEGEPQ